MSCTKKCFINSLSTVFASTCTFSVENDKLIDSDGIVKTIISTFTANEIVQNITEEFAYKESQLRKYEALINKPETKGEKLGREISKYGFLDLPKVENLSDESKVQLIDMIATNKIPYAIAMFDYLNFLKFLEDKHLQTKDKLHKEISKWFNSDSDGRTVKGNIASLSGHSKEDKKRYTAYKSKEKVAKDYEALR